MKINILLSSCFNHYLGQNNCGTIEILDKEPSVRCLLSILKIPESEVGFVMVNGIRCDLNYILHENDTVKILPQLIGG